MLTAIERVEAALQDLKQGKMVVLTDDPGRENEGDLIAAAETITTDQMNFMIRQGTGIVCLSMMADKLQELSLPLMVSERENSSQRGTPFTLSIDAKEGITTGVSAADRTATVHAVMKPHAKADDLVKPGHIFPLQAKEDGVLARRGHTEGSIDLVKLAGFQSAAVLCEIMNMDGTMARGEQLDEFAAKHQLTMLSIDDIVTYRLRTENRIAAEASAMIPIEKYGTFKMTVMREKNSLEEHVVLVNENKNTNAPWLVRIHSSCTTGDLFSSKRCDCNRQLHYALQKMSEEGGILIYLNQEGRGIGLFNKIQAYALQEKGFDTVEANQELGLPVDSREYHIAANILRNMHIDHIRLLTNNPSKISDLQKYGITSVDRVSMPSFHNEHNQHYLQTKALKLNHSINFEVAPDVVRVKK